MTNKPTNTTILIVDDEAMIRETLVDILEDEGYCVFCAENAEQAHAQYHAVQPNLVLLDIWMPDTDGITLLREWQTGAYPLVPIIMMSGHGTIETAVEATKLGAYDFLEKPLSTAKLLLTINRALQTQELITQNAVLKEKIDPPVHIVGKSLLMETLRDQAKNLAMQPVPLLITGAPGSGKRHIAHFIHQHSVWRDGPFISANISSTDASNILPVLLGSHQHAGLITQAENGTLYLDEIGNLDHDAQNTLQTLIEDNSYFPNNGREYRRIQLRLIAASQLPLEQLKERLNAVLFDQLTVATLTLPLLKSHSEDVPELLDYFSRYFADCEQMPYRHFTLLAQNTLRQHNWPGNIRELKNLVQRLLIRSDAQEIDADEAQSALTPIEPQIRDDIWSQIIPLDLSLREAREVFEHQYLLEQFRHCDGNIAKLAGRVGMDRTNLYRKLRSLGIDPTEKP